MKKRKLNRNRVHIDRAKLYNDYIIKELTAIEIANKYGCSYYVVYNRLIDYNIPRRKGSPKKAPRLSKKVLIKAYTIDKLSITEAAITLKVGRHIVERDLKFYNIPMRSKAEFTKGSGNYNWVEVDETKLLKLVEKGYTAAKICKFLNLKRRKVYSIARKHGIKFPNISKKKVINKVALKQFEKVLRHYYYDLNFNKRQILEFLDLTYISLENYFKEFNIKRKKNNSQ